MSRLWISALLIVACVVNVSEGFAVQRKIAPQSSTSLNIFGNALKDAFANDNVGPKQHAGLKNVSAFYKSKRSQGIK